MTVSDVVYSIIITLVVTGYVIQHAIVKSPLAADFLTGQCQQFLQDGGSDTGIFSQSGKHQL